MSLNRIVSIVIIVLAIGVLWLSQGHCADAKGGGGHAGGGAGHASSCALVPIAVLRVLLVSVQRLGARVVGALGVSIAFIATTARTRNSECAALNNVKLRVEARRKGLIVYATFAADRSCCSSDSSACATASDGGSACSTTSV